MHIYAYIYMHTCIHTYSYILIHTHIQLGWSEVKLKTAIPTNAMVSLNYIKLNRLRLKVRRCVFSYHQLCLLSFLTTKDTPCITGETPLLR